MVFAECVFVLESFYEQPRAHVARAMRALLALPAVTVLDEPLLLRALALYEGTPLHFADSYLVAVAELSGVGEVVSFDRDLDRIPSIDRAAP